MPLGLPVALALAAQAASAAAPTEAAPPATPEPCETPRPDPNDREIVICAERPQGYRIDPDILTVKRLKRGGGRPARPGLAGTRDASACAVGPHGCPSAGVNLMAAALTAAEMARRVASGQEIGSMFITDPQPSEYQLYLMAKRQREAREEAKAIAAAVKAAKASKEP